MTAHELMTNVNHFLIKGGVLSDKQKANIVKQLLSAKNTREMAKDFFKMDWTENNGYPLFYMPPNKNIKLQTVIPMSPFTHILSANSYELEILRLLHMFAAQDDDVCNMIEKTINRLKSSCFGYQKCAYGECFQTSIITLRFISVVLPDDAEWMKKQIEVFNKHYDERRRRRNDNILFYFWLCLSEMPSEIVEPEIHHHKERIIEQLNRSCLIKNENDDIALYVMRNTLARLPEYSSSSPIYFFICVAWSLKLFFSANFAYQLFY